MTATAMEETRTTEATAAKKPQLWGEINGQPLRIPVIGGTGEHGSGKTLFGLTIRPQSTFLTHSAEPAEKRGIPGFLWVEGCVF